MTRSITIINTSNWDGEDYELYMDYKHNPEGVAPKKIVLKPGDSYSYNPATMAVGVEAVEREGGINPFRLNGKQVFPQFISYLGCEGEARY